MAKFQNTPGGIELEKRTPPIIVEIIEYVENAVVSKTIIKKSTGNVTAMSFDTGEEPGDKISPFDNFIQIIDATAEITIDKTTHQLKLGNGIIIPALHSIVLMPRRNSRSSPPS